MAKTTLTLLSSIRAAARIDAAAFVFEFGEALDPDTTDWGALAWDPSEHGLPVGFSTPEERALVWRARRFGAAYDRLVARYTRGILCCN